MASHLKKNIDFKSRIKRIFSSPKSTDIDTAAEFEGGTISLSDSESGGSSGDAMDATMPTKPQRKVGKSRKSYDQNTDKLDTETAEVHGQSSTGVPRKSQDGQGSSAERRSQHLTEIAQLTILNERLSKENEVLRTKNLDLIAKKSGNSNANTGSSPHLCFRSKSGGHDSSADPPTIESLLLDRELLENLVWRLNVELGRYETRLQQLEREIIPEKHAAAAKSNSPAPAWCRADPATLAPLLQAYDEALVEKDQIIGNFEQQIQKLGAELREVVAENERLHEALEELQQKETETRDETELMQKDINNLHSENVILLEKLETEKTKNEVLSEEYASRMAYMQEQEALVTQSQTELKTLAREYGILEKQLAEAKLEIEQRIPAKHHEDAIADCRRLLEQLKQSYNEDRRVLEERNKALLVDKVTTETKVRSLNAEVAQNEARVQALEKLLRKTEARNEQLQTKLVGAESCRDSSVREVHQLMAIAEKLTADQETLLQQLHLHHGTNRRLSALRSSLKSVQKQLPEIERQLKAQENGVERMKGDHHREMLRLRSILQQKDQAIKQLQEERNSTCEQLEVVWKAVGFESLSFSDKCASQPHSLPETHRKIPS